MHLKRKKASSKFRGINGSFEFDLFESFLIDYISWEWTPTSCRNEMVRIRNALNIQFIHLELMYSQMYAIYLEWCIFWYQCYGEFMDSIVHWISFGCSIPMRMQASPLFDLFDENDWVSYTFFVCVWSPFNIHSVLRCPSENKCWIVPIFVQMNVYFFYDIFKCPTDFPKGSITYWQFSTGIFYCKPLLLINILRNFCNK